MRHFDLCVIGAGTGNSLIDKQLAHWDTALVDDGARFGGTCLNHGCIPTKMFVAPADHLRARDDAARLNVTLDGAVDWPGVRDRVFGRIDPLSEDGEAWRRRNAHVTLFRRTARFAGPRRLAVGDEEITADRFVIAAGSRPRRPDLPGCDHPDVAACLHTSDTIMRLDALPASLVVLGSGFVAAEFAHVFGSFGTRVTQLARSGRLLRREDAEVSARYTDAASAQYDVRLEHQATAVEPRRGGVRVHTRDADGRAHHVDAEVLLIAVGRIPNSDRLDVAAAGVEVDEDGFVRVDAHQATSAPGVWALGDVCSPLMLKHVANHQMRVVRHNLLHPDDLVTASRDAIPHAVFGHPQVAAVGLTEEQAREAGHDVTVAVQEYGSVAYGWALEDTASCAKLVADRSTGLLLGAHLIGPHASLLVQPLVQAMATGLDVRTMARGQFWIHPALTEVVENALLALDVDGRVA